MLVPSRTFREAINTFWRGEWKKQGSPSPWELPHAVLPFPCAPWTCQAGAGGHGRPATSSLVPQFPFSAYPPWVSGHILVLLNVPVDNLRSREDARQAREDSIPCQPTAQTGRQNPALAGAKHGLISWQNNSSLCSLFSQNNPLL